MDTSSIPVALDNPDLAVIDTVLLACVHDNAAGKLVSTAQAVEELRIMTGDFISSDRALADALSVRAIALGCAIVFDEQPGAGLVMPA